MLARLVRRGSAYHAPVDIEQRAKVCQLIEAVIAADGVVVPEERDFLKRAIARFKLPDLDEEGAHSIRDPGSATTTLRTLDPDVQTRVMALLVEAAVVDGVVEPNERALLLSAAAALGIEATALEERIARRLRSNVPGI
jgi:uncharacterized tellurite resistance protein B-like protein